MREIKFRAWDKHNNVMDYLGLDSEVWQVINSVLLGTNTRWKAMQYTGLKDKNGKEIYEGDILERPDYITKGETEREEVDYDIDYAEFNPFGGGDFSWVMSLEDVEVIGNVHENPELLKENNV